MNSRMAMLWTVAAAAVLALGGCQALGILFEPDPVAEPEFVLSKQPLLVLVDESPQRRLDPVIRTNLTKKLTEQLQREKVNQQIVPEENLRRLQKTNPTSSRWTEAELGRQLQAVQVLHVQMEPYFENNNAVDPTSRSQISAAVRVIDVASGDQLWPIETAGEMITFEMPVRSIQADQPDPQFKRQLANGLADRIAKLFYKHKMTDKQAFDRSARRGVMP